MSTKDKSQSPVRAPQLKQTEAERKIREALKQKNKPKDFWNSPYIYVAIGVAVVINIIFYSYNSKVLFPLTFDSTGLHARGDFFQKFIGSSGVKDVSRQLRSNSKIRSLDLNLALNGFNSDSLIDLSENLAGLKRLERLTLSVSHNAFSEEAFITLVRACGSLYELRHLELSLDGVDTVNYNTTGIFQLVLPKLADTLSTLKLSLIHTNLSLGGLDHVISGVSQLQQIVNLDLVLISVGLNTTGVDLIGNTINNFTNLRNLSLNFYANKIAVEGARILAPFIGGWKNLQGFNLDLFFNNVTREGAEKISSSISQLTNLTSLRLNLDFNYIENEGGIAVGNSLKPLQNLRSLSIGCASKNFGFSGFEGIAQGMRSLKQHQLENLTVVCGVNRVGPQGADELAQVIKYHEDTIRNLRIDFLENYVGDEGAQILTDLLPKLPLLQTLDLSLNFNYLLEHGVVTTMNNIDKIKNLKKLRVDLSHNEVDDRMAQKLFASVEKVAKQGFPFEFIFLDSAITNSTQDAVTNQFKNFDNFSLQINSIVSKEYLDRKAKDPSFTHTNEQKPEIDA